MEVFRVSWESRSLMGLVREVRNIGVPCGCRLKWDAASPSPLVLPAEATYTNHTGAETASSITETCRTIPIALDECK